MKTAEELDALTRELETLNKKLAELTGEDLTQVTGGSRLIIIGDGDPANSIGNTSGVIK